MSASIVMDGAVRSLLVAALAVIAAMLMRSRPAAVRAAFLRLALLIAFLSPFTVFLPALPILAPSSPDGVEASIAAAIVMPGALKAIYLAVSAALTLRLALGIAALVRWTSRASNLTSGPWQAAHRASAKDLDLVRVLNSADVQAPMSWGWPRAFILIDAATALGTRDARAILEHEFAHIRRRDWLFLVFSRIATAAFWFNPFVWALARMNEAAAEEAADQDACAAVDARDYAQSLIDCARRQSQWAPANAMDAGVLEARVRAILHPAVAMKSRWRRAPALVFGCAALLLSLNFGPPSAAAGAHVNGASPSPEETAAISREHQQTRAERENMARELRRYDAAREAGDGRGARVARELALASEGRALAAEGRAMAIEGRASMGARNVDQY